MSPTSESAPPAPLTPASRWRSPATAGARPAAPARALSERLVSLVRPGSIEAEQYRMLRHLVEQARRAADVKVLGVSSPASGDGKTLTAINLAGALAQASDTRVLLIDLDLRNPSVAEDMDLDLGTDGTLAALLDPTLELGDVVRQHAGSRLFVLPSSPAMNATYEILKSERCGELIAAARKQYDYVVVDLPPLIPIADCRIVERWLDAFLVVVAAHRTPRKMLEDALAVIDPAKVLGLLFNRDDAPLRSYGYGPRTRGAGVWRRLLGLPSPRPSRARRPVPATREGSATRSR